MKQLSIVLSSCLLLAANAAAQSLVPSAGLAAEGQERWSEALQIYRDQLAQNPSVADLWLRVADIEARLGRPHDSITALERAALLLPQSATVLARLSQAYAAQGHATAALRAIDGALALQGDSDEYLRSHATLATWAGEYDAAADSYRKLRQRHSNEHALILALARVSVWGGHSDAAASAYRDYLLATDALPEAWLELARTESWRGNSVAAMDALDQYRVKVGANSAYAHERVAILARSGRPRVALREIEPLLATAPRDFDLNLSRTVALAAARRHRAAASSLTRMEALRPGHADTRAAESVVRSLLGSNVGPSTTFYNDSDGLETIRVTPKADLGFRTDTRLHAGYDHINLQARIGSGLEQVSGSRAALVEHVWTGLSQRIGPLTIGGTTGYARSEGHERNTYAAFLRFVPADTLTMSVERSSGFAAISPRTAGLGLTKVSDSASIDWSPSLRYHVAVLAEHENLSDGNARWQVFVSPRAAVVRTQRLNIDLGLSLQQFGADYNLDNGYYDPERYEYYSVVVSPYWKASENIGIAVSAAFGGQRDDASRSFRLGSNASVEATFGIYEGWMLKMHGSTTSNRRLDSGAFRGLSGGVALLRRF